MTKRIFLKCFLWILFVAIIVSVSVLGFSYRNVLLVPSCPKNIEGVLTASPLDLNLPEFDVIFPLGNLNPPGHMIPTDHIYLGITKLNRDSNNKIPIYSPGDIMLSTINSSKTDWIDGRKTSDYGIYFTACRGVTIELGHVVELAPNIQKLVMNKRGSCQEGKKTEGDKNVQCQYRLNYQAKAGEIVGYVYGRRLGDVLLDFLTYNTNTSALDYANKKRYTDVGLHTFCPLDLYSGALKESLYAKLGGRDAKRTMEPRCGEIMQDIKGTAQGNWYGVSDDTKEYGTEAIALVHDNVDPSVAVVSVGGGVSNPGIMAFRPKPDGNINRDFKNITQDNKIYCFQNELFNVGGQKIPDKMLIQLQDNTHLRIEHQTGTCGANEMFSDPKIYER